MVWYDLQNDNMATIYFMRHGSVDNPGQIFYPPETALNAQGRQQVLVTAERMKDAGVVCTKIISSPLVRTSQTAEIVSSVFNNAVVTFDERLREWDVNGWIGKPFTEFYTHMGWIDGALTTEFPPDIESYSQLAKRMYEVVQQSIDMQEENILCISHGEPIACIAAYLQQKPWVEVRMHQIHLADVWKFSGPDALGAWTVDWAFGASAL